jgi:hypothetical protein
VTNFFLRSTLSPVLIKIFFLTAMSMSENKLNRELMIVGTWRINSSTWISLLGIFLLGNYLNYIGSGLKKV